MNGNKKNIFIIIILILILTAGTLSRFINLNAVSLWHDEAFSVLLSRMSFQEMTYRTGLDVHPPLYYWILKIWSWIFGQSLFAFRAMSVFFSLLSLVFVYLLLRQIKIKNYLFLFILACLAFAPFQIQYSQEMRMYSLGAFLIIASCYVLIKLIKNFSWLYFGVYTILTTAALYTHYYLIFSIIAHALIVLIWRKWRILFAYIIAGLAFLPWLPIFIRQTKQVANAFWIPMPSGTSVPNTLLRLILGSKVNIEQHWILYSGLICLSLFLIIWGLIKTKNKFKWLVFSCFAVPFILSLLLSLKQAIFLDRYFIFVHVFYYILILMGVFKLHKNILKYIIVSCFIILNIYGFISYTKALDAHNKPGMSAASRYINENAESVDQIFIGSSFVFFNFKYYNQTGIKPLLYAPGEMLHFSGTAILYNDDIIKEFPKKLKNPVYMINTTGFGNFQPEVPKAWHKINEQSFQEIHDYQGWIIITKYE